MELGGVITTIVTSILGGGVIGVVVTALVNKKKVNADAESVGIKSMLDINAAINDRLMHVEGRVANLEKENFTVKEENLLLRSENAAMKKEIDGIKRENVKLKRALEKAGIVYEGVDV